MAVVLTLVQTKQIRINIRKRNSTNNTKHSKYNHTHLQNTYTYTHLHVTKKIKTTTVQDTHQMSHKTIKYAQYNVTIMYTISGTLYKYEYTPFLLS